MSSFPQLCHVALYVFLFPTASPFLQVIWKLGHFAGEVIVISNPALCFVQMGLYKLLWTQEMDEIIGNKSPKLL